MTTSSARFVVRKILTTLARVSEPSASALRDELNAALLARHELQNPSDLPNLHALSPAYVEPQHKVYVQILTMALHQIGPESPLNIALAGNYGSGKSSVLQETQRVLAALGVEVINLSMPSLGIGDGRFARDADRGRAKTNLIQKEIVKQVLYRRRPSSMPASRYSRLDTFQTGRAWAVSIAVALVATIIAMLIRFPDAVQATLPGQAWSWLDQHVWGYLSRTLPWLSLLGVLALSAWVAHWVQRTLQQRLRITELAAGPAKVTLSDSSSSYFDEYLDEIVYFFQTTKTSVVIFEDLDRFDDPHIFEALRELNSLLNNAEQTGRLPIRFVYALRDSIFEERDTTTVGTDTPGATQSDGAGGGGAEQRTVNGTKDATEPSPIGSPRTALVDPGSSARQRLSATNRTKFFDLVVPMVPFISHRTARDLIRTQLAGVNESQRPSDDVIAVVGTHLTDMRLIKNICNEYEVFRRSILVESGLKELTPDRLFASIVYKNVYLTDYEKIGNGTSNLDALYVSYRQWAARNISAARTEEQIARAKLRDLDAIDSRANRLGLRLQEVLSSRHIFTLNTSGLRVQSAGTTYSWSDLQSAGFWRTYLEARDVMTITYSPAYSIGSEQMSFEMVEKQMGYELSTNDWMIEERIHAEGDLSRALADQIALQHASLAEALKMGDRRFEHGGLVRSMHEVAAERFEEHSLALDLLQWGLLDENFTLYMTQFPHGARSASVMNFIIKAVQPDLMDIDYHFGKDHRVDVGDIRALLAAEQPRLLGGQSVFNIELFDYLIATHSPLLDKPFERLGADDHKYGKFIDAYLVSGKDAAGFIERLAKVWRGTFAYLIDQDGQIKSLGLLDAALRGATPGLAYSVSAEQQAIIASALPRLPTVKNVQAPEPAQAIAGTLQIMSVSAADLSTVAEPLRGELVKRNLYPVTRGNLEAILGSTGIELDALMKYDPSHVYPYVIGHIRDYLAALDEIPDMPSIVNPDNFATVLTNVIGDDLKAFEMVAHRAGKDCILSNVTQMGPQLWPALANARKFSLTAHNVSAYITQYGIDKSLAKWLKSAGSIQVSAEDQTPLEPLALRLLDPVALGVVTAVRLVGSLSLPEGAINAASLSRDAHVFLPALVKGGLVRDDVYAYLSLGPDEWAIKKELIGESKNFPAYMAELDLSPSEVHAVASEDVSPAAKSVLLSMLGTFATKLDPRGATALAVWAAANEREVSANVIVTLATLGGTRSARPIVELLGARASTIDLASIQVTLTALGKPFNQLTLHGWDRPSIPNHNGMVAILRRLKNEGIVSKFTENSQKGEFDVSKHHGP